MSQNSSTQSERLVEFNKLLPELKIFLRHILDNEPLSESSKGDCATFIERLQNITKPPSLPPRSGRSSTTTAVGLENQEENDTLSNTSVNKIDTENNSALTDSLVSQDFIASQREISRNGTLWQADRKPILPPKPSFEEENLFSAQPSPQETFETQETGNVYVRIGSVTSDEKDKLFKTHKKNPSESSVAPPVPARKKKISLSKAKVIDLPHPLYSGLLRNVGSNTKQWCVIKYQKLFLFNDLQEPVAFIADLSKYEVIKDPSEMYVFRVTQHDQPSIVLAAVDEGQYELWHDAFKRAKSEYLLLPEASEDEDVENEIDEEEPDGPYERPEDFLVDKERIRSPDDLYVPMNNFVSPRPMSPPKYETMESVRTVYGEKLTDYPSMPLPPLPGTEDEEAPPLPARQNRGMTLPSADHRDKYNDSHDSSSESLSGMKSDEIDVSKSKSSSLLGSNLRKIVAKSKEEVFDDASAVYSGILHHRRMLAVWQKRYCKIKDQSLLCYRSADAIEPILSISLPGHKLDIAEETWKSFSFKIFKEGTDSCAYYFAAVSHQEQINWLKVLAKEIDKERFASTPKLDTSHTFAISSEESYDSNDTEDSDDGDADSESLESEGAKKLRSTPLRNQYLHPAYKIGKKNRQRSGSFEDPTAEHQGYLYRKFKNHWSKRWCVVKEKKFLSYKNTPSERPDSSVLLEYAALTTPIDNEHATSAGYFLFKLRYEGDQKVLYGTKREDECVKWITTIKKYVASTSEEAFPYVNVPPHTPNPSRGESVDAEDSECLTVSDFSRPPSSLPLRASADSLSTSSTPITPLTPNSGIGFTQRRTQAPLWSEKEIEDSFINGKLTELQICNLSFRHIERFVLITKEKWLKVYEAINSTTPILSFNALDIEVKEDNGVDAQVLHLLLGNVEVELLLKAADKYDCDLWKNAFDKIHYEEIDDDEDGQTVRRTPLRPRSRSNDKKDRSTDKKDAIVGSQSHTALSRTLPNLGKRKKAAKDRKELTKTKSITNSPTCDSPSVHRKKGGNTISSLIRSFTVDTLGRKAKNKSYELPRDPTKEEDIVLKETQRGIIKQVIKKDSNELYEEKFCRVRGKVFQCYNQEFDTKPLFKVPLKNAAIQDFANPGTSLFRFIITALDTGVEYTFALDNERELDNWTRALFGDDQLHKSLENSPQIPRRISSSTFYTPTSPLSKRTSLVSTHTSIGSKDSFAEDEEESDVLADREERRSTDPFQVVDANDSIDKNIDIIESVREGTLKDSDVRSHSSSFNGSVSSMTDLDGKCSPVTKQRLKPVSEEPIKLNHAMFEVSQSGMSRTKTKRWIILRKSVLELYKSEVEKCPLRIVRLASSELIEIEAESGKDGLKITLKSDDCGSELVLIAPNENVHKVWLDEIKRLCRSLKRRKNPRHSVGIIMRRLGSAEKMKELKSKKDKRISMLLVDDDVEAIEKFGETADPAKMMSGILWEMLDDNKVGSEKGRSCWIKNGVFHIAKLVKPDKPVRSIDLSTVVILDESDPATRKHAFRLDFTKEDGSHSFISMRASDEESADKWMVAISMGILYHRLSTPQTKEANEDEDTLGQHDFDFVSLSQQQQPREQFGSRSRPILDGQTKEEIEKKLNHNDTEDLRLIAELLKEESPGKTSADDVDGEESPGITNTDDVDGEESSSVTNTDNVDGEESGSSSNQNLLAPSESINPVRRLSDLVDEEDHVFSNNDHLNSDDTRNGHGNNNANRKTQINGKACETTFEELENIPEKENADQSFKNVKGILRQQESIRLTILKNQRQKKVPPPVKPKPKTPIALNRSSSQFTYRKSVLKKYGSVEHLSINKLQTYQEQLEGEKTAILKCSKNMNIVVQEAKANLNKTRTESEKALSELEYKTVCADLERLQSQLLAVEKELKEVQKFITRKVASKNARVTGSDANGNRLRSGSYTSEPPVTDSLRDSRGRMHGDKTDVDSIII